MQEISSLEREPKPPQMELDIEPRVIQTREDFLKHLESLKLFRACAIALDGRVSDPPFIDNNLLAANFDHHKGVDRATTPSTCKQVLEALITGRLETFKENGQPKFRLFLEDCDEDVCTSVALFELYLKDPGLLQNPLVQELVEMENKLDVSAGMYSPTAEEEELMAKVRWIFEPYRSKRRSSEIYKMMGPEMESVIREVVSRIRAFVDGRAESLKFDGRYQVLLGAKDLWKMVSEIGRDARVQIRKDGVSTIASAYQVQYEGEYTSRWKYTLVGFPRQTELYDFLNQKEGINIKKSDRWGGSNLSGGSPKLMNSKFGPSELEILINEFLKKYCGKQIVSLTPEECGFFGGA